MITETVRLTGYKGSVMATPGDRFKWDDGSTWQIEGFTGHLSYSPSGLGGQPVVVARIVDGEVGPQFVKYTKDGICEWCGDSVASALLS